MATENGNGFHLGRDFWMKVAAGAFSLWALAIPIGIEMLRSSLSEIQEDIHLLTSKAQEYRLVTERRMTLLEERQDKGGRQVAEHEARLAILERELGVGVRELTPRQREQK